MRADSFSTRRLNQASPDYGRFRAEAESPTRNESAWMPIMCEIGPYGWIFIFCSRLRAKSFGVEGRVES